MIERIEGLAEAYNPIQDHIEIQFQRCETDSEKLRFIADTFEEQGFDPSISSCLVFVNSRKKCEQLTVAFEDILNEGRSIQGDHVGFYHAGMEAEDRQATYARFRDGELVLLFATKAFGMGMDIKNIHFLFHFSPPGTFEDFLQEVGRAGRNKEARLAAGFGQNRKIKAICLYSSSDFTTMKTRLHESRLGWNQLKETKNLLEEYAVSIRGNTSPSPYPIAIPFNLKNTKTSKPGEKEDVKFRLALHWLECLNRIELGYFTVTHFDFDSESLKLLRTTDFSSTEPFQQELLKTLAASIQPDYPGPAIQLSISVLRSALKCPLEKLMGGLVMAHKSGWIKLIQKTAMYSPEHREKEIRHCKDLLNKDNDKYIGIRILFAFARKILSQVLEGESRTFKADDLEGLLAEVLEPYYDLDRLSWSEEQRPDRQKKEVGKYFKGAKTTAAKHVFAVLECLPKLRHLSDINSVEISFSGKTSVPQVISNGYRTAGEAANELRLIENHCVGLISYVTTQKEVSGVSAFVWADLFKEPSLTLPDNLSYFLNLLMICSKAGYLFHSGLFPSGIEVYLKSTEEVPDFPSQNTPDGEVFAEFNEVARSRELKLIALQSLQEISKGDERSLERQDKFIKAYFQCSSSDDLLKLLVENLGFEHSSLAAYRAEAYKEAISKLNEEQKLVFEYPIDKNLNVIAGPGSGKTHTLVLRIARFVQEQNVAPSEILVLAYNRAVVSELKDRLGKLFRSLGYHQLIERLDIYTFHGYMKKCLGNLLTDKDFKDYSPTFISTWRTSPGIILERTRGVKYVFVDEFQDITDTRLEVLQIITERSKIRATATQVTVIGDPNQSIYGYERDKEKGQISPKPCYGKFKGHYNSEDLSLVTNHRSLPQILERSTKWLNLNEDRFENATPAPWKIKIAEADAWSIKTYVESIKPEKENWLISLIGLMEERKPEGQPYQEIAVMFRDGNELFRGYDKIVNRFVNRVRVRIQGEAEYFMKTREVAYLVREYLNPNLTEPLPLDLGSDFTNFRNQVKVPDCWDLYLWDVFHACILEYRHERQEHSTYKDLLDYIEEFTRKDDGQLSKIYHQNAQNLPGYSKETTIVLTTIHKTKGLEFDAVLLPPSFAPIPFGARILPTDPTFKDRVEEERRVRYVAYSRAKYRLVEFPWHREKILIEGTSSWQLSSDLSSNLGKACHPGLDKFMLDYVAMQASSMFDHIHASIRQGDELELWPNGESWNVKVKGRNVGFIRRNRTENGVLIRTLPFQAGNPIKGLRVSQILVRTAAETIKADEEASLRIPNYLPFYNNWSDSAKARGYSYIVDFAGYGREIEEPI